MGRKSGGKPSQAIAWKDEYLIGIDAVDRDHQSLINRFNDILDRQPATHSAEAIQETIGGLEAIFKDHFDNEEAVMAAIGFPELAEHREKHETFLRMLAELRQFRPGCGDFNEYFLRAFRNWIVYHITVNDREIGRFLAAKPAPSAGSAAP
ncbi:MAG: hemerythrin family protein [Rhodospirillaceae bacterium]